MLNRLVLTWVFSALLAVPQALAAEARTLARDRDPVVLEGSQVPSLLGIPPGRLVAFRWNGGWQQAPVQVDERATIDFGRVRGQAFGPVVLHYADAGTFAGADPDASLDADDEIALRARDAGDRVACEDAGEPLGGVAGTGVEVEALDPLTGGRGWFYLFRGEDTIDPAAGVPDVGYDFVLLSGDYLDTYVTGAGTNPEDSRVTTSTYSMHFADRWIRDEIRVFAGASSGADILDRHRNVFAPGACSRSEDTFCEGGGGFVVNASGPVRALRAYVGANSGPFTERAHWFYEDRHDVRTTLRVHEVGGMMDLYDLSQAAVGMTYHDARTPGGVAVNGRPDAVAPGPLSWTMIVGAPGALFSCGALDTTFTDLDIASHYQDDDRASPAPCTGDDDAEMGTSGVHISSLIPSTDPFLGEGSLVGWRVDTFGPPGTPPSEAPVRQAEAFTPIAASAAAFACIAPPTCDALLIAPVTSLRLTHSGGDVVLAWAPDAMADGAFAWRVEDVTSIPTMRSGGGARAVAGCSERGTCRDAGAAAAASPRLLLYSVAESCAGVEGP